MSTILIIILILLLIRSLANVALQLRLGLLSRWWPWPDPDHSDHLGTHGTNLSVFKAESARRSDVAGRRSTPAFVPYYVGQTVLRLDFEMLT